MTNHRSRSSCRGSILWASMLARSLGKPTGKIRMEAIRGSHESTHMVEFDHRVKSGNLFYQAWYNQGLRAIDISNPFRPREVGYYISPDFSINVPGQKGRHTREPYPDWNSDLIYVTDGNG